MIILYIVLALLPFGWFCSLPVAPKEMTNFLQRDPAARNYFEVMLLYPGLHAVVSHRYAHFFYEHKLFFIARLISQLSRAFTGIEIHPVQKSEKDFL